MMNQLRLQYTARFIVLISGALCVLTRQLWLIFPMLLAAIYVFTVKPKSDDEKEKLDKYYFKVLSNTFFFSVLVFFLLLMIAFVFLFLKHKM